MKLRIRDNSIRIRLSQTEVSNLEKGQMISNELHFPGGTTLCFQLLGGEHFKAIYEEDRVQVSIPESSIRKWVNSDELSLSKDLTVSEDTSLWLLIEKDLQCKTERPREDDSDAFPNPLTENC